MIIHIDGNNLVMLTHFSSKTKDSLYSSFLNRVFSFCSRFNTLDVCFYWDSPRSYRKKLYADYKNRKHKEDLTEVYDQIKTLRTELLPGLGWDMQLMLPGFEADDLIATQVLGSKGKNIVVSADQDLHQLLDHCQIVKPTTGKIYTKNNLKKEKGILPSDIPKLKAISGCPSDTIPGVAGVGETGALKYLKGELAPTSKTYQKIIESDLQYLPLVELPLEYNGKSPKQQEILPHGLTLENAERVMEEYDLCIADEFLEEIHD